MNRALLLETMLDRHGVAWERLGVRDKWKAAQRWRVAFARSVKESSGKWTIGGVDWHAFSYGVEPCLQGARAEQAYEEHDADVRDFFVRFVSAQEDAVYRCRTSALPPLAAWNGVPNVDRYIWASDCTWTMVFTHEQESMGVGPYFAEAAED